MFDWVINTVAGFFHVSSSELAKLEASLPATKKLVELFNKNKDLIPRAQKLTEEVMPIVNQAVQIFNQNQSLITEIQQFDKDIKPVMDEALLEWKTVGPALSLLIDILERNKKKGISADHTVNHLKLSLSNVT